MRIKIRYEVERVIYISDDGYTIAKVKMLRHPKEVKIPTAETIIIGPSPPAFTKDEFEAEGEWIDTGMNGWQFKIDYAKLLMPETSKGIMLFLKRYSKGARIGEKTVKTIVKEYQEDTMMVIEKDYKQLTKLGIPEKKAKAMHNAVVEYKSFEDLLTFLLQHQVSYTDSIRIYEMHGRRSDSLMRENPYSVVDILGFKKVDEIGQKLGVKANADIRLKKAVIQFIAKHIGERGDLFTYREDIIKGLNGYLKKYGVFDEVIDNKDINKTISTMIKEYKLVVEWNKESQECLYIKYYNDIENRIVGYITDLINSNQINKYTVDEIEKAIDEVETYNLEEHQRKSIVMALTNKIAILTGGPGTGKTQTVNTLIDTIKRLKPDATIELAAPTGKAAKRMAELTGKEAKTIHRLIGLNTLSPIIKDLIPVTADYLIIDEASMIDAHLFYWLLYSVMEDTTILIVGDHEQLPSVGAGLILRDLINSNKIPTTRLTKIFRQAENSQIVMNAHRVINGIKELQLDESKKDFYLIEEEAVIKIQALIMKSISRLLKLDYTMNDIQVLSTMNKGDLGVNELNRLIQEEFNPPLQGKPEYKISFNRVLRVNDRVMQTVNNYDIEIFNGEVGIITEIKDNTIKVNFGDKTAEYSKEIIPELTLAYAITVHKSQGSEFKAVIMPIHKSLAYMLNRNIIYTGLTRARDKVVLIGNKEELYKGIDNSDNTIRNSRIKEKLMMIKPSLPLKE